MMIYPLRDLLGGVLWGFSYLPGQVYYQWWEVFDWT